MAPSPRTRRSTRRPLTSIARDAKSDDDADDGHYSSADEAANEKDLDDEDDEGSVDSASGSDEEEEEQAETKKRKRATKKKTAKATTTTTTTTKRKATKKKSSKTTAAAKATAKKKTTAKIKGSKKQTEADEEDGDASGSDGESSDNRSSGSESETKGRKKSSGTARKRKKSTKVGAGVGATEEETTTDAASPSSRSKSRSPSKKAKKIGHQNLTERDEIPRLWDATKMTEENGSYTMKIASWNVAGLRAVMRKMPEALGDLVKKHDLDVLCLQETKLQEDHLDDPKLKIRGHLLEDEGYDAYYSCSTTKKGYSGTAVFVRRRQTARSTKGDGSGKKKNAKQTTMKGFFDTKKKSASDDADGGGTSQEPKTKKGDNGDGNGLPIDAEYLVPQSVSYKMGVDKHDNEGRIVVVDFPLFTMCNVYVPNAGQKLERLQYRTEEWDRDLLNFARDKAGTRGVPVMWLGDLNVAHTNLEVWNDGAKHLPKQAGVTPEERASFQAQLDSGFVDAFRSLHPDAKGHYSYWSQRAGNRPPNKGLRLDYFVCQPEFFQAKSSKVIARDSYMLYDQEGSDHCPVVLELEIKP